MSLLSRKAELLRGVRPGWLRLLDGAALDAALRAVDAALGGVACSPAPHLIFEPFRHCEPAECDVVIMGQDPYAKVSDAQGLCFSTTARPLPQALGRIFGCLERAGLRRADQADGDLRPWAAQGVLLINAAFTTAAGVRNGHKSQWRAVTNGLLTGFCAERRAAGATVHFLLWGGPAREYAGLATRAGHVALEWSHPSPLSDNKLSLALRFRECPHFERVNAARAAAGRPPIDWDNTRAAPAAPAPAAPAPVEEPRGVEYLTNPGSEFPIYATILCEGARGPGASLLIFTDGGCAQNGKPGARAGFATAIAGGAGGPELARAAVHPFEYEFVDTARPEAGVRATATPIAPSNNRGELLGIIHGLLAAAREAALAAVEVCTDSKVSLQGLAETHLARFERGGATALKNPDLLRIAWRLLGGIRERGARVALLRVNSHKPEPGPPRERLFWRGNQLADKHATIALTQPCGYALEEFVDLPELASLASAAAALAPKKAASAVLEAPTLSALEALVAECAPNARTADEAMLAILAALAV